MPKRRRAAGGSGAGGGAPAAAAALEEPAGSGPRGAPEYRPAEWLRGFLGGRELYALDQHRGYVQSAGPEALNLLAPEERARLADIAARHAGEALRRRLSPSPEERARAREESERRMAFLRLVDPGAADALEREFARYWMYEAGRIVMRPGWSSRTGTPLRVAEGETRRFRELWERWNAWRRGDALEPLSGEEAGELYEYLQRRLVLPMRRIREASSGEEREAAGAQLRERWRQLEDFAVRTFPETWASEIGLLRGGVEDALRFSASPPGGSPLEREASALEEARRQAMAAASGATDPESLERAYAEFSRAREAAEAAAERYRSAGAALPEELGRALRLAAEWDARLRRELDRRRARSG